MKHSRVPFLALLALLSSTSLSAADDVVVVTDTVEAQATVVAVNRLQRRIVLRDSQAREYEIIAGPEVRNFDHIKEGDVVDVLYQQAAASRLDKVAGASAAAEINRVERAPPGAKPGVSAVRARSITAKVIEIDTRHRLLTVQGPQGRVVTVRVPAGLMAFDELQVGDTIAAGYTEAIAISVRAPGGTK